MVKRSRLEIYFDVLRVVRKGVSKPTRIMYSANLSWNSLQGVIKALIKQGFIVESRVKSSRRYHIAPKGENVLAYYSKAVDGLQMIALNSRR